MPKSYSEQERLDALSLLYHNRNNVALTSRQCGIPERTLREWRRMQRLENWLPPVRKMAEVAQEFENREEALDHVYKTFVDELVSIANGLPDLLYGVPPYQQLQTMMKILDRLELLKLLTTTTPPESTIRIEFLDNDGSIHNTPYYQRKLSGE